MCTLSFEWTKSAWGLVTKPFTERIWKSEQEDGTLISVVKSGVNGLAMIFAPVACLVMALVTPLFAAFDLIYHPLKECFFPELPGRLPISSKAFYDGGPLDSGATFGAICGWTDRQIEEDPSFLYWMFPSHLERDLEQGKMVQGLARMMTFYGLFLNEGAIHTTDHTEQRKVDLAAPHHLENITRIHSCLNRYGLNGLAESLAGHFFHLQPDQVPNDGILSGAFG